MREYLKVGRTLEYSVTSREKKVIILKYIDRYTNIRSLTRTDFIDYRL